MPPVEKRHGMFTWADLNTPDQKAATAFYTSLFGWDHRDDPIDETSVYTMLSKDGHTVAGLGQQPAEMKGAPAMWMSYVKVDDLDEVAERVGDLGGTVAMGPMDVMDAGRLALVQDPSGATLGLWQDGNHTGADIFNEPGAMSWNELATRDLDAAKSFYADLLDWTLKTEDVGDGFMYTTVNLDGDHVNGGMMAMDDSWPAEIPPHWQVYFTVEDVDATAARAKELGGSVQVEPFDAAVGRFAVLSDPQGGAFSLYKPSQT